MSVRKPCQLCGSVPVYIETGNRNIHPIEDRLRSALEAAVELLDVAVCPNCDGSGSWAEKISEDEWTQIQCQWCAEKADVKALREKLSK